MIKTPDYWVFVKIIPLDPTVPSPPNRILCSWYDHWQMSSGNLEVIDRDTYWEALQKSGTIYHLYKNREGISRMIESALNEYNNEAKDYKVVVDDYSKKV